MGISVKISNNCKMAIQWLAVEAQSILPTYSSVGVSAELRTQAVHGRQWMVGWLHAICEVKKGC